MFKYLSIEIFKDEAEQEDFPNKAEEINDDFERKTLEKMEQIAPMAFELLEDAEKKQLILLRKKDEVSFEHSLEVFNIGEKKISIFEKDLQTEGVSKETFLRACALHDLGKMKMPDCVLKDTTIGSDFENKFFEFKDIDPDFIDKKLIKSGVLSKGQSIKDFSREQISEMNLNFKDLVSLEYFFEDDKESTEELANNNINLKEKSFFDVVRQHEIDSRHIIERMDGLKDKEIIAEIVGSHHNYDGQVFRELTLAKEIVRLADEEQALRQKRQYKKGMRNLDVLYVLAKDTNKGLFIEETARKWLKDDFGQIDIDSVGEKDKQKYELVKTFIEKG